MNNKQSKPITRFNDHGASCKGHQIRRTKLRLVGHSTASELKREVQAILRKIVILRDKTCVMSYHKDEIVHQYRDCGGLKKNGELILQAEHLHSRANASSFSDSRLVVCICPRHHLYYKKQYPDEYYRIVRGHIGKERSDLLNKVQQDRTPYKVDLKLEKLALEKELESINDASFRVGGDRGNDNLSTY